ncbi:MAG: type II secretion system protein GspG [Candidatus Omnitrophota bacterium]
MSASSVRANEPRSSAEMVNTQTAIDTNFATALTLYKLDTGTYPTTGQGLRALLVKPESDPIPIGWNGPYLSGVYPDPWGHPYGYRFPAKLNTGAPAMYDLWSCGPDGVVSADDITNGEWVQRQLNYKTQTKLDVNTQEKIQTLCTNIPKTFPYFHVSQVTVTGDWTFVMRAEGADAPFPLELTAGLEKSQVFEKVNFKTSVFNETDPRHAYALIITGEITEKGLSFDADAVLAVIDSSLKESAIFKNRQKRLQDARTQEDRRQYRSAIQGYEGFLRVLDPGSEEFKETQTKIRQLKQKEQEEAEAQKWIKAPQGGSALDNAGMAKALQAQISLDIRDMPLVDTLKFLSIKGRIPMESLMPVNGSVTMLVNKTPIKDVLSAILHDNHLAFHIEKSVVYIMTENMFKERYGKDFQ